MLTKLTGPCCPKCGCPDSELVNARETFSNRQNVSTETRECGFCAVQFQVRVTRPAPQFIVLRCPFCHSDKVLNTGKGSGGGVRFHRCVECRRAFRSIERDPADDQGDDPTKVHAERAA